MLEDLQTLKQKVLVRVEIASEFLLILMYLTLFEKL